jgi:hypothetical protein
MDKNRNAETTKAVRDVWVSAATEGKAKATHFFYGWLEDLREEAVEDSIFARGEIHEKPYTPTTDEVRYAYSKYMNIGVGTDPDEAVADFNRWMIREDEN